MRKNWLMVPGLLVLALLITSENGWGLDMSAGPGDTNVSGGVGIVNATGNAVIYGTSGTPGSYAIQTGDTINNTGTVTVNGHGTLIVENGADYVNSGTTTINAGGTLQLDNGSSLTNNASNMEFASGSSYVRNGAPGSVYFSNEGDLTINTNLSDASGVAGSGIADILADIDMQGTGKLILEGSTDYLGKTLSYTVDNMVGDSNVVIATTGDYTGVVEVALSNLQIWSTTTFQNTVDGKNIIIGDQSSATPSAMTATFQNTVKTAAATDTFAVLNQGTALFSGTNADLAQGIVAVNAGGNLIFENSATMTSGGAVTNAGNIIVRTNASYAGAGLITNSGTFTVAGTGTYAGTGGINNTGTLTFEAGSTYSGAGAITNNSGGKIYYATGMTGIGAAFADTDLLANSDLFITGGGAVADNLLLNSGAANSRVTVQDGATFDGQVDVKSSTLIVNGGSDTFFNNAVTASEIIVDHSVGTTFKNAVNGNLTVNSVATLDNTATFSTHNIVVAAGGTLTNKSNNITISLGNTLDNSGTLNNNGRITNLGTVTNQANANYTNNGTFDNNNAFVNSGTFTNNGTYQGTGSFTNNHYFINNGAFNNQTTIPGAITNATTGTMWFNTGTAYNLTGSLIHNQGTINASAQITSASLRRLMSDLYLQTGSTFNLNTDTTDVSLAGAYAFGNTDTGSTVNINPGVHDITLATNASINAGNADMNIGKGTLVLSDNTALTTTGDFTAQADSHIDFATQNPGYTATITANDATFSGKSLLEVGDQNTLHINTTGATGTTFASDSRVVLGEAAVIETTGDITFASNTKMEITATPTTISQITTTGVGSNITVSSSGTTEVVFHGVTADIINKIFLWAQNGQVINYDLLYNPLYKFDIDTSLGGEGVVVSGLRSMVDSMADALGGYGYLSINKINGGKYTDQVLGTTWGSTNTDLLDYIQEAGKPTLGWDKSFAAYGQLFGEYAAYSYTALLASNNHFKDVLQQRMAIYRGQRIAANCNTCYEYVDPSCNTCGGEAVVVSSSNPAVISAGRGNVWGGVFGDWSRQKDLKYITGYDYSAGGVMLGYDYSNDCLTVGVAGSYTNGSLKVNKLNTKFDTDTLNIGAYANYVHDSGAYIQGQLAYGYGWNDYDVGMILGGTKNGDYKNQSYYAGLEIGYRIDLPGEARFVPHVGLDFTHVSQEGWTESVHRSGGPILANQFDRQRFNVVEIPVGARLNKTYIVGDTKLMPEVRAAYIYQANDHRYNIGSGYAGSNASTTMFGVDNGRSRGTVGGGFRMVFSDCVEVAADYDYHFKRGYHDHRLAGTVGISF